MITYFTGGKKMDWQYLQVWLKPDHRPVVTKLSLTPSDVTLFLKFESWASQIVSFVLFLEAWSGKTIHYWKMEWWDISEKGEKVFLIYSYPINHIVTLQIYLQPLLESGTTVRHCKRFRPTVFLTCSFLYLWGFSMCVYKEFEKRTQLNLKLD